MLNTKKTILVVSSLTKISTANYVTNSLKKLGYSVVTASDKGSFGSDAYKTYGAVNVHNLCHKLEISPILILFIEGGTMQVLPIGLEKMNCITAWYGIDTHMDYNKHLRISRLFDVTFVAQKEYVSRLTSDGIKQAHWLPLGFAPELLPLKNLDRDIDISYVGSINVNINPHRHQLISNLKDNFNSNSFGLASPKEMGEIYSRSKIVFNKSVKNDINMRFFEAMGTGAVLVTDPIMENGLEDLFERNKHYITYENDNELIPTVASLLSEPDRLAEISKNVQKLILEKHTYDHRAKSILEICHHSEKSAYPKSADYLPALVVLKLYGGAIYCLGVALKETSGGGWRRYIALVSSWLLRGISHPINCFEAILNKIAK